MSHQNEILYSLIFLLSANEVCEDYVFTSVCQSFCSQGFCLSACWDTHLPPEQTPPWEQTPPRAESRHPQSRHPPRANTRPQEQTPPWSSPLAQCMLGDMGNKRVVRILLKCIFVNVILSLKRAMFSRTLGISTSLKNNKKISSFISL